MSTLLKRSTVKKFALHVSKTQRAGKFTRVGTSFFQRCDAKMEATLRAIYRGDVGPITPIAAEEGDKFVSPYAKSKAGEQLELLAKDIVFNEVRSHPSLGKTLR